MIFKILETSKKNLWRRENKKNTDSRIKIILTKWMEKKKIEQNENKI